MKSLLIVGGGISGLVLAATLKDDYKITLVERNDHVGGRIHSMKNYECGAYRIHRSHERVFALAKRLGVALEPWHLDYAYVGMKQPPFGDKKGAKNMTWWDVAAANNGLKVAEWEDMGSGYRGGTDVYSQAYPMDMEDKDGWYFAPEGLSSLVDGLVETIGKDVTIHLSTRLVECDNHLNVHFLARDPSIPTRKRYDKIIFATSPLQVQHLSIMKTYGMPLVSAVQWEPLHRIYAKVRGLDGRPWPAKGLTRRELRVLEKTKIISPSLLGQTLGVPPMRGKSHLPIIQVAYCEGQVARFWQDLILSKGHEAFVKRLTQEVNEVLSLFFDRKVDVRLTDVDSHYWSEAVHGWWAAFGKGHDETLAVLKQDKVYLANEALSYNQGWIEGSLESVERMLGFFEGEATGLPRYTLKDLETLKAKGKEYVVLDGRVLDVGKWKAVHPGSTKAIDNHLYEDISTLWHVIHAHYSDAWRQVLPLQIGWLK